MTFKDRLTAIKILIHLFFSRFKILRAHIKVKGWSDGWWVWQIENNIILDPTGDWLDSTTEQMKHAAIKEKWNGNYEAGEGIDQFIVDMKNFHKHVHKK